MSNFDDYNEGMCLINYANEKIIDVINLLNEVGMEKLSGRLYKSHEQINIAVFKIEKYVDEALIREVRNSNESTNMVLKLALSGCLKNPE